MLMMSAAETLAENQVAVEGWERGPTKCDWSVVMEGGIKQRSVSCKELAGNHTVSLDT